MAISKNEAAPAGANTPAETVVTQPAAPVAQPVAPRRDLGGLAIAGIVVGSVLVAGALFGGGVAVGAQLPDGMTQSQPGPGFGPGIDRDNDTGSLGFPGGDVRPGQPGAGQPGMGQPHTGQPKPGEPGPGQLGPNDGDSDTDTNTDDGTQTN